MSNLPQFLTPSKINTHSTCRFKYWAHYIGRVPKIKTPIAPALFGGAVHDIIVNYYNKIDEGIKVDEIAYPMEEAFLEGADYKTDAYKVRLKKIQRNFRDFEIQRINYGWKKPLLLEERLRAELFEELPPFEGIIDAFFEDVGVVVDWKTGKYEEMSSERMVQGKIYEMLLKANGHDVKGVLFNNLNLGRQLTLPKITDGWIKNIGEQMVSSILSNRFPKTENGLCNGWCEYALACSFSGACPWSDI